MGLKEFFEITWNKIILTILLFLIFPLKVTPIFPESLSHWKWFVGIEFVKDLFRTSLEDIYALVLMIILSLLIGYLISCFIILIYRKVKR